MGIWDRDLGAYFLGGDRAFPHTHTHSLTLSLTPSHSRTHSYALKYPHNYPITLSRTHTHSLIQYSHTLAPHTLTRTHTRDGVCVCVCARALYGLGGESLGSYCVNASVCVSVRECLWVWGSGCGIGWMYMWVWVRGLKICEWVLGHVSASVSAYECVWLSVCEPESVWKWEV